MLKLSKAHKKALQIGLAIHRALLYRCSGGLFYTVMVIH